MKCPRCGKINISGERHAHIIICFYNLKVGFYRARNKFMSWLDKKITSWINGN